jgi:hypothetical protein
MSTTMITKDHQLWSHNDSMNPKESSALLWLFNRKETTLFILHPSNPTTIKLSTHALLDCALLDTHDAYWSSNADDIPLIKEHSKLQIYHARLRSLVERDLLQQHGKSQGPLKTPAVLHPWIQRTVWLYGHDEHGRKSFAEANHPNLSDHEGEDKSAFQ